MMLYHFGQITSLTLLRFRLFDEQYDGSKLPFMTFSSNLLSIFPLGLYLPAT